MIQRRERERYITLLGREACCRDRRDEWSRLLPGWVTLLDVTQRVDDHAHRVRAKCRLSDHEGLPQTYLEAGVGADAGENDVDEFSVGCC